MLQNYYQNYLFISHSIDCIFFQAPQDAHTPNKLRDVNEITIFAALRVKPSKGISSKLWKFIAQSGR